MCLFGVDDLIADSPPPTYPLNQSQANGAGGGHGMSGRLNVSNASGSNSQRLATGQSSGTNRQEPSPMDMSIGPQQTPQGMIDVKLKDLVVNSCVKIYVGQGSARSMLSYNK